MAIYLHAYDCKIYFNYQPAAGGRCFGWSQIWHLLDQDFPAALVTARALGEALSWILGQNCWIEWVEVLELTSPPRALPEPNTPLGPYAQFAAPNNPGTTLLFRWETAGGYGCYHHFHCFGDGEVSNKAWIRGPWTQPAGPVARPATPWLSTADDLWAYAMALLRDKTCHQSVASSGHGGIPRWELKPWVDVFYVRVSFQFIGHLWRRVSWEADVYADSAGFTPCGTVVGVLHTCYSVECYFYVGDAGRRIRYYWADPAADVIDVPTIFWGWAKDKKIDTQYDVGELPGKSYRTYSLGLAWGIAPGIGVDGTADDFLGLTPLTPALIAPPDPLLLPGCDVPAPIPITVDDDPGAVTVLNVTRMSFVEEDFEVTEVAPGWARVRASESLRAPDIRDANGYRWTLDAFLRRIYTAGFPTVAWGSMHSLYHNEVHCLPFFPGAGGTVGGLHFEVVVPGPVGSAAQMAVYEGLTDGTAGPGVLIFGSGDVDTSTIGMKDIPCLFLMQPDRLYFLAIKYTGVSPCYIQATSKFLGFPWLGHNPSSFVNNMHVQILGIDLSGVWDDPWGYGITGPSYLEPFRTYEYPALGLHFESGSLLPPTLPASPSLAFTVELSADVATYSPGTMAFTLELVAVVVTYTPPTMSISPVIEFILEASAAVGTTTPPTMSLAPVIEFTLEGETTIVTGGDVVFLDSFTDGDFTDLDSHAPDVGTDWTVTVGKFSIISNVLVCNVDSETPFAEAIYATPLADGQLSAVINSGTGLLATDYVQLFFRWADINNTWEILLTNDAGAYDGRLVIVRTVGGVRTDMYNHAIAGFADSTDYLVEVKYYGTSIRLFLDGALITTITSSANQANTAAGLSVFAAPNPSDMYIEDFTIKT